MYVSLSVNPDLKLSSLHCRCKSAGALVLLRNKPVEAEPNVVLPLLTCILQGFQKPACHRRRWYSVYHAGPASDHPRIHGLSQPDCSSRLAGNLAAAGRGAPDTLRTTRQTVGENWRYLTEPVP